MDDEKKKKKNGVRIEALFDAEWLRMNIYIRTFEIISCETADSEIKRRQLTKKGTRI